MSGLGHAFKPEAQNLFAELVYHISQPVIGAAIEEKIVEADIEVEIPLNIVFPNDFFHLLEALFNGR